MNKKDITLIAIIVIIAVIASNITMLYILRTIPFIHSNDFIAIAVALIGIMVTFAIGYQIFTTLDIKQQTSKINEINELQKKLEGLALKVEMENCLISANKTDNHEIVNVVNSIAQLVRALLLRIQYSKYIICDEVIETSTFTYRNEKNIAHFEYILLKAYIKFFDVIINYLHEIDIELICDIIPNSVKINSKIYHKNNMINYLVQTNKKCTNVLNNNHDNADVKRKLIQIKQTVEAYHTHYYECNKTLINID